MRWNSDAYNKLYKKEDIKKPVKTENEDIAVLEEEAETAIEVDTDEKKTEV